MLIRGLAKKLAEIEMEELMKCKGQIFRASVSSYGGVYEDKRWNRSDIKIGFRTELRRMKTLSCPGCNHCGYLFDLLYEININDFPVEGIEKCEHKKLYKLVGVFSPDHFHSDAELDGLQFQEVLKPEKA